MAKSDFKLLIINNIVSIENLTKIVYNNYYDLLSKNYN